MSLVSKALFIISMFQLLHSGFSSHEFLTLKKRLATQSELDVAHMLLPKDVQLEAICGVVLLTLSIFMSFSKLQSIPLGGKLKILRSNEYLKEISMNKATNAKNLIGCDPYGGTTYLPNLVDIHAKREEIKQWRKAHEKDNSATKP